MSARMVDKPTKAKAKAVESVLPAGKCPACGTWLYCRDGTHTCVSVNNGPSRPTGRRT